jgi:hypothetical protein
MDSAIIIEKLKRLIDNGTKIGEIEIAVGFPKNNLSAVLKGKKPLSEKWVAPFDKYLNEGKIENKEDEIEKLKFVIKSLNEQAFVIMEDGSIKKLNGEERLIGFRTLQEYLRISGATIDDLISVHKTHLVRYAGISEAIKNNPMVLTTSNNGQAMDINFQAKAKSTYNPKSNPKFQKLYGNKE